MLELALILLVVVIALVAWLAFRVIDLHRKLAELPPVVGQGQEERHRAMLLDLHDGLTRQGDRLTVALADNSERLRGSTA